MERRRAVFDSMRIPCRARVRQVDSLRSISVAPLIRRFAPLFRMRICHESNCLTIRRFIGLVDCVRGSERTSEHSGNFYAGFGHLPDLLAKVSAMVASAVPD